MNLRTIAPLALGAALMMPSEGHRVSAGRDAAQDIESGTRDRLTKVLKPIGVDPYTFKYNGKEGMVVHLRIPKDVFEGTVPAAINLRIRSAFEGVFLLRDVEGYRELPEGPGKLDRRFSILLEESDPENPHEILLRSLKPGHPYRVDLRMEPRNREDPAAAIKRIKEDDAAFVVFAKTWEKYLPPRP